MKKLINWFMEKFNSYDIKLLEKETLNEKVFENNFRIGKIEMPKDWIRI